MRRGGSRDYLLDESMPYEIVRNDITRMRVDAIVNTANPEPIIGSGTDYAIHKAAGPKLLEARKKIGDIDEGCAAATPAFGLRAKYVLHTVSPVWQDGEHGEPELLRRAYDAALELAAQLKCRSVAFPLMAAGAYGFPHDCALLTAVQAISEFVLRHRMHVYLVLFGSEATAAAADLFADLKTYIDDHYVDKRMREEYGPYLNITGRRRYNVRPDAAPRPEWEDEVDNCSLSAPGPAPDAVPSAPPAGARRPAKAARPSYAAGSAPASFGRELDEFLRGSEPTFTEHLLSLLGECGEKDSVVYHRAGLSRQLFNKIVNNRGYQPKKETAIQLAIGLRLDMAQTQALLGKAGYALSRSSKVDLAVQYFIERRIHNMVIINEALYDAGLPLFKIC